MPMILRTSGLALVLGAVISSSMVGQGIRPTYEGPPVTAFVLWVEARAVAPQERTSSLITTTVTSSSLDGTERGILVGGAAGAVMAGVLYTLAISSSEDDWELENMLFASLFGGLIGASIGGILGS